MPTDSDSEDRVSELNKLPREVIPDAAVEGRVIDALRAEALLRRPIPRRPMATWLAAAGIALVAFGLGTFAGRPDTEQAPNATFALMLYGGSTGGDSLEHAQRADEYRRWARTDHEWGRVLGGEALGDPIGAAGGNIQPVDRSSELVGFFLVAARDRDAVMRLASDCPHIKYGGKVVVREILPT